VNSAGPIHRYPSRRLRSEELVVGPTSGKHAEPVCTRPRRTSRRISFRLAPATRIPTKDEPNRPSGWHRARNVIPESLGTQRVIDRVRVDVKIVSDSDERPTIALSTDIIGL
jgi:hypothetical protein